MAIVMLINAETTRDGFQYLNDIVAVFPDTHQFSATELQKFDFLTIKGSKEDVKMRLNQIVPRIEECFYWEEDDEYHWMEPIKKPISYISQANPAIVSVFQHGYKTGMVVVVAEVGESMEQITGRHVITVIDPGNFSIDVDLSVSLPYPGGGLVKEKTRMYSVFQVEGSKRWYKMENDFKFPVNIGNLTPEEKQILETVDINHPSVDSFIRKLVKDMTVLSGNDVEVRELRNSEP
jgi:hypothetical protein